MFLTENVNYNDSILFLLSARMALKESIELSDVEGKNQLKDFIVNEATDYEVMSLLVDGKFPEEKYNHVNEIMLFSKFKDQLVENAEVISESIDSEIINDVLFEVNSIYPEYSTATNVIEFMQEAEDDDAAAYEKAQDKAIKKEKEPKEKRKKAFIDFKNKIIDKLKSTADKGKTAWNTLSVNQKKLGKGIGATALTTLAIYSAYKAYKRFFSKAAKSCSGLSGSEKTKCIKDYKIQGYEAQIEELQRGMKACQTTKNPEKCRAVLDTKIAKLEKKISEVK